MKTAILRPYPTFLDMAQVVFPPIRKSLSDSDVYAGAFSAADTNVRYEISYLQHGRASGVLICGTGSSHWKEVRRHLETATHIEGRLTRALSVRLFYSITATSKQLRY